MDLPALAVLSQAAAKIAIPAFLGFTGSMMRDLRPLPLCS